MYLCIYVSRYLGIYVFFSRAFLTADCSVARTVLLVSLQACGHGSRMCIGEGQVQAGLLTSGLGVGCSGVGWWLQRGSH